MQMHESTCTFYLTTVYMESYFFILFVKMVYILISIFNQQPLITRLMMKYLMPDPEQEKQKRDAHLRRIRDKCDA